VRGLVKSHVFSAYRRSVLRGAVRYVQRRFPVQTLGVAIVFAFSCGYAMYGRISGHQTVGVGTFTSAVTQLVLFLQLRLIDDIADLPDDTHGAQLDASLLGYSRNHLCHGLVATVIFIVLLNVASPLAAAVALSGTGLAVAGTFVLKPALTPAGSQEAHTTGSVGSNGVLAVFFEGAPFAMLLYGYLKWSFITGATVESIDVVAVTGCFWAQYEYWKYSRAMERPAWAPYGLTWRAARTVLVGILAVGLACQLATLSLIDAPRWSLGYAALSSVGFACWTLLVSPRGGGPALLARRRGLAGIAYVAFANLGFAAALIASG
jgi:hypothetical protein